MDEKPTEFRCLARNEEYATENICHKDSWIVGKAFLNIRHMHYSSQSSLQIIDSGAQDYSSAKIVIDCIDKHKYFWIQVDAIIRRSYFWQCTVWPAACRRCPGRCCPTGGLSKGSGTGIDSGSYCSYSPWNSIKAECLHFASSGGAL